MHGHPIDGGPRFELTLLNAQKRALEEIPPFDWLPPEPARR
jgi:hypothetical protein